MLQSELTDHTLVNQESFAGLTVTKTFKPSIHASEYPTLDTRPKDAVVRAISVSSCLLLIISNRQKRLKGSRIILIFGTWTLKMTSM